MARRNTRWDDDEFDSWDEEDARRNSKKSGRTRNYDSDSFDNRDTQDDDGYDEDMFWVGEDGEMIRTKKRISRKRGLNPVLLLIPLVLVILGFGLSKILGGGDESVPTQPPVIQNQETQADIPTLPVIPEQTQSQDDWSDDAWTQPDNDFETQPYIPDIIQPEPTVSQQPEPPADPMADVEFGYFGRQLSDRKKELYARIYRSIRDYETETPNLILKTLGELDEIVKAVSGDHPELFWFRGSYHSTYYDREDHVELNLYYDYHFTLKEATANKAFVEAQTQDILARLAGKSDYEKVMGVYDFLVDNTIYDLAYTGTTIYDMLYYRRGVCEGYARLNQYLLNKLGVETLYIVSADGGHAWNIVKVDGEYYQMDVTWGDPVAPDHEQTKNHNYCLITDEIMYRDHTPERWDIPVCTATRWNYFRVNDRYMEYYDAQKMKNWIIGAANQQASLEFMCANRDVRNYVVKQVLENGELFNLMEQALGAQYGYSYSYNETADTVTVYIDW